MTASGGDDRRSRPVTSSGAHRRDDEPGGGPVRPDGPPRPPAEPRSLPTNAAPAIAAAAAVDPVAVLPPPPPPPRPDCGFPIAVLLPPRGHRRQPSPRKDLYTSDSQPRAVACPQHRSRRGEAAACRQAHRCRRRGCTPGRREGYAHRQSRATSGTEGRRRPAIRRRVAGHGAASRNSAGAPKPMPPGGRSLPHLRGPARTGGWKAHQWASMPICCVAGMFDLEVTLWVPSDCQR